jgi:hypothetical protein
MGRYMATPIPNSHIAFYPGEGDLSLTAKYMEEILKVLVA